MQKLYLKRKQANNWDEDEERDDQMFLDIERKIYDNMCGDEDSNNEDDFEDISDDDDPSV